MNTKTFKKQILLQDVQMGGSVNFNMNGDINFFPCPWESDKEVTSGQRVRYKGGIEVDADGRTRVKRYNYGMNGPMHETLFETRHGAVKMTRPQVRPSSGRRRIDEEFVYVTFKFPKKYGLALTKTFFEEEADEVMSYLKTMNVLSEREQSECICFAEREKGRMKFKEETVWK